MYCKYCAALIDDDSLVCSACGKTLGQSISSPIPSTPVMIPQSQVQQPVQPMPIPQIMPQQPQMMPQQAMMPTGQPMMSSVYQAQPQTMQPAMQQPIVMPNIVINNSSNATSNNTNNVHNGAAGMYGMVSDKSKTVALLLCLFLGVFGIHRFYVGKIGTGLLYMFTLGFGGVGVLIDLLLIILDRFRDRYGRFVMV